MKVKNTYRNLFIIVWVIIIVYTIYTASVIYSYGKINDLTKADAAIVLGAAVWGEEPSPVFKERIEHGIWLYKNGYVDKIIFTGGKGENQEIAESIVAKRYAEMKKVPSEDILIETKSKITQENLYYAKQVAERNEIDNFLVVSDPLNMKRAMMLAEDYELEVHSSPTTTTRYKSVKSKAGFLTREVYYYIGYKIYKLFSK